MKITSIETQKKTPGRVNIYVDGEFLVGLDGKLIIDFDLFKGKEINEKEIETIKSADSLSKCLERAYRLLSFRPRSEYELKQRLTEKFPEETANQTINKLKEYNYVNDSDFAEAWVRERGKSKGKRALKYELVKKGISKEVIDMALEALTNTDEQKSAYELILNKTKYDKLERSEGYPKIAGYLTRKGYSYDVIKGVIEKIYGS